MGSVLSTLMVSTFIFVSEGDSVSISFKKPSGRKTSIDIAADATVGDLINRAPSAFEDERKLHLSVAGKSLTNKMESIAHAGISAGTEVHVGYQFDLTSRDDLFKLWGQLTDGRDHTFDLVMKLEYTGDDVLEITMDGKFGQLSRSDETTNSFQRVYEATMEMSHPQLTGKSAGTKKPSFKWEVETWWKNSDQKPKKVLLTEYEDGTKKIRFAPNPRSDLITFYSTECYPNFDPECRTSMAPYGDSKVISNTFTLKN